MPSVFVLNNVNTKFTRWQIRVTIRWSSLTKVSYDLWTLHCLTSLMVSQWLTGDLISDRTVVVDCIVWRGVGVTAVCLSPTRWWSPPIGELALRCIYNEQWPHQCWTGDLACLDCLDTKLQLDFKSLKNFSLETSLLAKYLSPILCLFDSTKRQFKSLDNYLLWILIDNWLAKSQLND